LQIIYETDFLVPGLNSTGSEFSMTSGLKGVYKQS